MLHAMTSRHMRLGIITIFILYQVIMLTTADGALHVLRISVQILLLFVLPPIPLIRKKLVLLFGLVAFIIPISLKSFVLTPIIMENVAMWVLLIKMCLCMLHGIVQL